MNIKYTLEQEILTVGMALGGKKCLRKSLRDNQASLGPAKVLHFSMQERKSVGERDIDFL
jgi:hypothetical protein